MASLKRSSDSEGKLCAKKRFDALINSRKYGVEDLSENSKVALQDAVFQLITHHQDVDELLREGVTNGGGNRLPLADVVSTEELTSCLTCDDVTLTVSSLTSVIRDKARLVGSPVAVTAADVCAVELTNVLTGRDTSQSGLGGSVRQSGPLSGEKQRRCEILLKTAEDFVKRNAFSLSHFLRLICELDSIPLFVTWQLHLSGVVPLDVFLLRKQQDGKFVSSFCKQLSNGDGEVSEENFCVIVKGILSFLVTAGYSDRQDENTALKKICVAILERWMTGYLDNIHQGRGDQKTVDLIGQLMVSKELDNGTLRRFSTQLICLILNCGSERQVYEAVKSQHQWTYAKSPEHLTSLIKQLFILFSCNEIGETLRATLERQDIGWRNTLMLTSTFLLCYQEAPSYLKDLLKTLLNQAVETSDRDSLAQVFLLARQACLEGPQVFPAYRDWFQATFGDSARSPANYRKSFVFLTKFLSDIVPYEPAAYLKVHILKPPFVPSKCREILWEFLALAKTRLADLKDPIDTGGLEESSDSGTSDRTKAQKLEEEIQKTLSVFESSGKLPSSIIEASIFKKPYYLGRFLPALLKPRPLPDTPDVRMKLIEELRRTEKLPSSMYTGYTKACEREKAQLLEGLNLDEDSMEDALLEPLDQLTFRLNQLVETLGASVPKPGRNRDGVKEVLSHVSEKIEALLSADPSADCTGGAGGQSCPESDPIELCLVCPGLTHTQLQVVDAVLNAVCRMVVTGRSRSTQLAESLLGLTKMLSRHSPVYPALVSRLYKLITEKGPTLENHHISGIAAILICIGVTSQLWPPISCHNTKMSGAGFVEHLIGRLPLGCSQWMMFSLKFCTCYLQHCFCLFSHTSCLPQDDHSAFLPTLLITKFAYISSRLVPGLWYYKADEDGPTCSTDDPVHSPEIASDPLFVSQHIFTSPVFQRLLKTSQVSFSDWIRYEMQVDPVEDSLSERDRYQYYTQMTHNDFIPRSLSEGGCGGSYTEACSQLLTSILHHRPQYDTSGVCLQCQKDAPKRMRGDRNRDGMLRLLQNLSMYLVNTCGEQSAGEQKVTELPWLLTCLSRSITKEGSEGMTIKFQLEEFFRVAVSLSPSLFFTNSLCEIRESFLQGAVDFINTSLKHHLSEGCCFPFHLTAYFIQGLSAVCQSSKSSEIIPNLLDSCPLVISSVLFHWKRLGQLVAPFLAGCGQEVRTSLVAVRTWSLRCFDGTSPEMDMQPHWLCAIAFIAMVTERSSQPPSGLWPQIQQKCPNVLLPIAECLTHCLTWIYTFSQSENGGDKVQGVLEETFCQAITLQPIVLQDLCSHGTDSFVTQQLIGPVLNQLTPATLLKVLVKMQKRSELVRLFEWSRPEVTMAVLTVHVDCGHLYDNFGSRERDCEQMYQPFSLDMLKDAKFLRSCLMHFLETLPVVDVANLNQDLIQTCDPIIRSIVNRRLSQT